MRIFRIISSEDCIITVKKFLSDIYKYLMADLAFQAAEYSRWDEKQKSQYITALIRGMAPSKFIFADVEECLKFARENHSPLDIEYYQSWIDAGVYYLNIDSNNRTINIFDFVNDKFPILPGNYYINDTHIQIVAGKNDTYSTMPKALRERFEQSCITATLYSDPSREELSDLFININNGKPLNAPEKRNAKTSNIAAVIRELSNQFYDRFVGDDISWIMKKEANRRKIDDFIASMALVFFYGLQHSSSEKSLWDMYESGSVASKNAPQFKSFFIKFMKFADDENLKAIPNKNSFFDLFVIWSQNKDESIELIDGKKSEFIKRFIDVCGELINDDTLYYGKEFGVNSNNWKSPKNFVTMIGGRQDGNTRLRNKLITNKIDMKSFFEKKEIKPRRATKNTKLGSAVRDKWKTPEGKDIDRSKLHDGETYHGGHVIPYADGGDNTIDNIKIQEASDNQKLGRNTIKTVV